MEPEEYFGAFEKLFGETEEIRVLYEGVNSHKELTTKLWKMVEKTMKQAEMMRYSVQYSEEFKQFVNEMGAILVDTKKMLSTLHTAHKVKQFFMAQKYDSSLNLIIRTLTQLRKKSYFILLMKQYDGKDITSVTVEQTWSLPGIIEACQFCHVTYEGTIIIGGQKNSTMYQMMAYHEDGNQLWHWVLPEEIGEPSDVAQVTTLGPLNENQKQLALMCPQVNKIVLLDVENRAVQPVPAHELREEDHVFGNMIRLDNPQRLVISVNSRESNACCHLQVLSGSQPPFHMIRKIEIDTSQISSLSFMSHHSVMVGCTEPASLQVYDVTEGQLEWSLPAKNDMMMGATTVIARKICVYDRNSNSVVMAEAQTWKNTILNDQAGHISALGWYPMLGGKMLLLQKSPENNAVKMSVCDLLKSREK